MRVIVAGSRSFKDYELLCKTLDEMEITSIISGGARGADRLGERYAKERGIPLEQYPAQWDRYGNQAGFIRNVEMAENADTLVAFWDGFSGGTLHMITVAKERGLQVKVVRF
jgi:hypothetical protein